MPGGEPGSLGGLGSMGSLGSREARGAIYVYILYIYIPILGRPEGARCGKVIERKIYELDKRVQHLQNVILGMRGVIYIYNSIP